MIARNHNEIEEQIGIWHKLVQCFDEESQGARSTRPEISKIPKKSCRIVLFMAVNQETRL